MSYSRHPEPAISPEGWALLRRVRNIALVVLVLLMGLITLMGSWYTIEPGTRGVVVTLGRPAEGSVGPGLGFKPPWLSRVERVSVRQHTERFAIDAFSSDLQHLRIDLSVLYQIPDASVLDVVVKYGGNVYESLIVPRVNEALKEVTALETAEHIAKTREKVKIKALGLARAKVGSGFILEDLVITNIKLSDELEKAIESKMVQEQQAAKAKFSQLQAEIEAKTAAIRAEGEAKAISIRGEAIAKNPQIVELQIVERWNGVSPLVVGAGQGATVLLPVGK